MSDATPGPTSVSPCVSVLIVTWNAREDVVRCLAALRESTRLRFETIVVDNGSGDGTPAAARAAFPEARVLENARNDGFARANNRGLREARAPYVLVLNPDAELRPGALDVLARHLDAHPRVGAVGPRTLNEDGTIQVSFGPDLSFGSEWAQRRLVRGVQARRGAALAEAERLAARSWEPDWVSGACLLARREALEAVGGFDEGFFLYEEDADLCRRLRAAGWRVAFTPEAEVVHRLGRSMAQATGRARAEYQRSHLLYYRKHKGSLATLGLRALIAVTAVARLLRALGPGDAARARREEARTALGIALRGD
jgi:N-acetylglucosaminyl-diphospho-decaprenol L-rhamnosyltransferase